MKYILFSLFCLLSFIICGQNDTVLYEIKLQDNSKIKGYIIKENDDSLYLSNPLFGILGFKNDDIKYIGKSKSKVLPYEKELMYKNTYMFSDNAIMQKQGSTYVEIQELVALKMSYAITNSLNIEFGTTLLDEYLEPDEFVPTIGIKYGHSFSKYLHLSAKSFAIIGGINLLQNSIIATVGTPSNNISLGLQHAKFSYMRFGFTTNETISNNKLGFTVGGMLDLTKKLDIRMEYIGLNNNLSIFSLGLGLNYKYFNTTLGIFIPRNNISTFNYYHDYGLVLPYFSFKIPFYTPQ